MVTRTEQIVRQAPYLEDFQKRILEAGFARGETPVDIPDIEVAALDPLTQQAITTGRGIGQFMPFLQTGADTLGTGLATLQERAAMSPELFAQAQRAALGSTQAYDPRPSFSLGMLPPPPDFAVALGPGDGRFTDSLPPGADPAEEYRKEFLTPRAPGGFRAMGSAMGSGDAPELMAAAPTQEMLRRDPNLSYDAKSDSFVRRPSAAGIGMVARPQGGVKAFMDPYQQAVTREALGEMGRQADIQRNQLAAQAVGAGAFGGSRQGIAEAELGRNLADIQSRRIFEDLSRNYNQAQNASQTAFENQQRRQQGVAQLLGGLGSTTTQEAARLGAGIAGIGTTQANIAGTGQSLIGQQAQLLSQLGATQQTQAQRELDAARQSQLQQAYEPFQRVSFMSDIFKPQIGSAQSTLGVQVAPSPSPISQAIGAGIAGFGVNKALGNPFGDLFGSSR